ncbi:hypothetical protein MNL08_04075 [Bartonella krasnovii]|uniref:hypothetical protein n=1 Tax=Bartonella krasnovii TaxID=2267275 RepID=UPI001F4CABB2|nr:hypothetical protein [Bartonella krasnovii]UNF43008.1 hypothetical protein MNL08_04075 [Bartonella krasnovii]UNF44551.1 hypothetical protein MNL07_03480 [Bartonella krasnovii]UNF56218.1 hypothetical protein MNL00_04085 [Bartonella krasnovii]
MVFFPIADYRPDVAVVNSSFTDILVNVLPADGGYIPMASAMVVSKVPLEEKPLGCIAFRSGNGVKIIVGGKQKLYSYDSQTQAWKDISQSGVTYQAHEENKWSFALFGETIIAVNKNDKPQAFNVRSSERFADLGGGPPRAGLVKVWGDFVCLMQLTDHPNRIHWSGLNDATHWKIQEKDCYYTDFHDGEYVQGATESTNPVVFLRSAIYVGSFTLGSKVPFVFQKVHDKRGARSAGSIACHGSNAFFAGDGGFYQISSDGQLLPIGFEKVDRTVFKTFDKFALDEMQGVIDPVDNRIYWSLKRGNNEQTTFVYDWGLQKWSTIQGKPFTLFPVFTTGYTLEQLDEISINLETLPASLDSPRWQSGVPILGGFNDQNHLVMFAGTPMEATVVSQEMGAPDGSFSFITKMFAEVDTTQGLLSIGERRLRNHDTPITWHKERECSYVTGAYHGRSRNRYHRFKLRIPEHEPWTMITGFNVDLRPLGRG